MTDKKKTTKAKAKTTTPVISEEVAVEVEKPAPVVADSTMVKVTNKTKYFHIQRSTGIRIEAGETKELKKDGWLEAEIKAGLFKLA